MEDRVGPDLPDHKRTPLGENIGIEAPQFLDRLLVALAPVHLEPMPIWHDLPSARRGRGSHRHNPDRPFALERLREMRMTRSQTASC
jgi:hypothetical protein